MKENEILHGFRLIKEQTVKEVGSEAFEFVHEKTGARLFYLKNDDDNKVFSIAFRTPPTDDTGVAHIVEHSVLCGSRKYPLKEPFVELVKGSMNTFLNAMTYPDKTVYPVASRNDKDFKNLMDVYLDAVFYPEIYRKPEILMQEGWHYEIENPEEPLRYSGVVYNEMKGALSSPDDLLSRRIMASLFPDTTYGCESGGDPEAIPALTQEMFIDFHRRYYHPSNSYIYLYGDLDLEERLEYLDVEYLSKFEKIPVPSKIDRQQAFGEMKRIEEFYPISQDEATEEKTFLSLNLLTGESLDTKTMLGLSILEHALLRSPAAPLRKALVDAHLGMDVDSSFEDELLQPMFSIIINSSEADRAEKFYGLVMEKLKELREQGIDRTLLEASINLFEFRLREADFGSAPKGLIYGLRSLRSWLYEGDPALYLYYENILAEIKAEFQKGYFEELVDRYFLKNTHKTLLILKPSKTMATEREKVQEEALAKLKAGLSKEELRQILDNVKNLKARQQEPEKPENLAKIPLLKRSDIRKESDVLPLEERSLGDVKMLFSNVETHGILYMNLYFDASRLPQEKLHYAYLLSDLLGNVDTKRHSYEDLANLVNLNVGGFSQELSAYTRKNEPDSFMPILKLKSKALATKIPALCSILSEILTESIFTNSKRIREIVEQEIVGIELSLQRSAHTLVAGRIASYLGRAGAYNDSGVLPYYRFLKDFLAHYEERFEEVSETLAEILPCIVNQNGLLASATSNEEIYGSLAKELPSLIASFSDRVYPEADYRFELKPLNEGLMSPSRVQYVAKGANYIKLGHEYKGTLRVVETILRYDYFWNRIRVQGGAYGALTGFNQNGFMYFGSYRDPRLTETLEVFDSTAEYLRNFEVSDREMDKYVIGTMSNVDAPLTPQMKGNAAAECYIRGISYEDRQKSRNEIIATKQEDIRRVADIIDDCMKADCLCVFGNEELLRKEKDIFGSLSSATE